jgi:hypothetical protein
VWTRYPCGVACGAGDLVEQQKPLEGGSWTTSALYLQGISLVRRNNEWHHFDPLGTAQVITNSSAQVVSNNVYDVLGVLRYEQGSAQTPWRWVWIPAGEEGLRVCPKGQFYWPERMIIPLFERLHPADCPTFEGNFTRSFCLRVYEACERDAQREREQCNAKAELGLGLGGGLICWMICGRLPGKLGSYCGLVCGEALTTYLYSTDPLSPILCDQRYTNRLGFCVTCLQMCLQSSITVEPLPRLQSGYYFRLENVAAALPYHII